MSSKDILKLKYKWVSIDFFFRFITFYPLLINFFYSIWHYMTNLTKIRPLYTISHRGSDNSTLQIVSKWTLYELCLRMYYAMISTNQIAYFKRSAVYWRWQNRVVYFQLHCIMILTNQIAYFKRSALFLRMTKSFSLLSVA